jgi:K+-transporting ATPase ATPase C chain
VDRVARARGLSPDEVRRIVADHTSGRALGFMGQPAVNVVAVNLALDGRNG